MKAQATLIAAVILIIIILVLTIPLTQIIKTLSSKSKEKVVLSMEEPLRSIALYNANTISINFFHPVSGTITCLNITNNGINSITRIFENKRTILSRCFSNYRYDIVLKQNHKVSVCRDLKYRVIISPATHYYRDEVLHKVEFSYLQLLLLGWPYVVVTPPLVINMTDILMYTNLSKISNIITIPLRQRYITSGHIPLNISLIVYASPSCSNSYLVFAPVRIYIKNSTSMLKCTYRDLSNSLINTTEGFLGDRMGVLRGILTSCNLTPIINIENITVYLQDSLLRRNITSNITVVKYQVLRRDAPSIFLSASVTTRNVVNLGGICYNYTVGHYRFYIDCEITPIPIWFFGIYYSYIVYEINVTIPLNNEIRSNITKLAVGLYLGFSVDDVHIVPIRRRREFAIVNIYSYLYYLQRVYNGTSDILLGYIPLEANCTYYNFPGFTVGECTDRKGPLGLIALNGKPFSIRAISVVGYIILETYASSSIPTYVRMSLNFTNASLVPVR